MNRILCKSAIITVGFMVLVACALDLPLHEADAFVIQMVTGGIALAILIAGIIMARSLHRQVADHSPR